MSYKKGLDHIPENELIGVAIIGSWILDRVKIDAAHREEWEQKVRAFSHPAAREAGMFFLCGEQTTHPDAKAIVEAIIRWHNDKHEYIQGFRKKHQK